MLSYKKMCKAWNGENFDEFIDFWMMIWCERDAFDCFIEERSMGLR